MYKCVCGICNEEYDSKSPKRLICYKDHIQKCPDCGVDVVWNTLRPFTGCKPCNQKRAVIKRKRTMLAIYGAPTSLQSPILKAKAKATIKTKYGIDNINQLPSVIAKRKATCKARYGFENPMQDPTIKEKAVAVRNQNIRATTEKIKATWLKKYGVPNVMFVPEIVNKISDTMISKYGVKSAVMVPEFKQKMIETNRKRYDTDYFITTVNSDNERYHRKSATNMKLGKRLTELGLTVSYEYPIEDYSYDIYVKELNLLLEVDPTYTHNVFGNHWRAEGISSIYHSQKTAVAEHAGFRCIHIFDWDDINKIIALFVAKQRIYARDCDVREVDPNEADRFVDLYHLQGRSQCTIISVGLYYSDELVEVMTFGRPQYDNQFDWELLRLCTKTGVSIIGGASRLFAYAIKQYNLHNIVSYCDRSKFTGGVYDKLGMKLNYTTAPEVHWSRGSEIMSLFNEEESDEIKLIEEGWLPVYDCGMAVYTYDSSCADTKVSDKSVKSLPKIDYKDIYAARRKSKERLCKFCGKPFIPNGNRQFYCKEPHYRNCPICNKEYLETNVEKLKRSPTTCSIECRKKLTEQICLEKYGVTAPGCIPHKGVKHKKKEAQ